MSIVQLKADTRVCEDGAFYSKVIILDNSYKVK